MPWWKPTLDDFTNRVVLITGGSRGIGFVTAKMFLEKGAHVGICSLDSKRLAAAETKLKQFGDVEATVVDVRDAVSVQRFVTEVQDRFGHIDILVNNAGKLWVGLFMQQDISSIDELIDVNLKGVVYATHAVLPYGKFTLTSTAA